MSLFNFNPSSFLGSGAFTLDPSKFDFSNIKIPTPKPVDDPVAIVSDNTPDTEVEILEGAGTVTVTEKTPDPDPIEEAIKAVVKPTPVETAVKSEVKPVPVPQPEVVIPEMFTPTAPVDLGMNFGLGDAQVSTDNLPASSVGDASLQTGFDVPVNSEAVKQIEEKVKTQGELVGQAEQQAFGDFTFNIVQNSELAGADKQLFSSNEREQVFAQASENFDEAKNKLMEAYEAQGLNPDGITDAQVLSGLGLPNLMYSDDPEDNMDLFWQWDSEAKEFKKTDRRPDELKEAAINVAVGVGMAAMTGGIASSIGAIAGGAGATAGTAKAIGNVVANTVVQGVTTGSVDPKDLAVAAINGYADGVQQAVKTGEVTKELAAQADLIKDISTSVDLVKAVEDKDVLGAISSGLELADLDSPASYIKDTFGTTDAQTKGILKVADKQLQGENLEDSIKSGLTEWVKEGGLSEIELSGSFDIPDINIEIPEELKEIGDALANGASELNRNVIKPLVDTVENIGTEVVGIADEVVRALPFEKEDFENLEDTVKTSLSDFDDKVLQPTKDTIVETAQGIETFYEDTIQPAIAQGITDTKQLLSDFDDNVLQPIKKSGEEVIKTVDERLGAFDDDVLQPIKDDIVGAIETVDKALGEIKEAGEESIEYIDTALSDLNKDVIKPALQTIEENYGKVEDMVKDELSAFDDNVLQPLKEDVEGVVKSVDEKLTQFDDEVLQPTKDTIIETAQGIETFYKDTIEPSIEQGIEDTKQLLADFDSNVLQPIKKSGEEVLAAVDEKLGEFDDNVLQPIKDDITGVIETVDQALKDFDDNVLQEIKEAGEAGIEYVDNALSDLNKNVIKPALDSIEKALDDIDVDTDGLKNMIKSLFDMVNFSNKATASMIKTASAREFEPVDLTNVELLTPEVVEGFEYDNLSNKLLA